MVAPNSLSPFWGGQPVRLRVSFLAWRVRQGVGALGLCRGPDAGLSRFLTAADELRYHGSGDKPGSCVVTTADGAAWTCPLDFLAAADRRVAA